MKKIWHQLKVGLLIVATVLTVGTTFIFYQMTFNRELKNEQTVMGQELRMQREQLLRVSDREDWAAAEQLLQESEVSGDVWLLYSEQGNLVYPQETTLPYDHVQKLVPYADQKLSGQPLVEIVNEKVQTGNHLGGVIHLLSESENNYLALVRPFDDLIRTSLLSALVFGSFSFLFWLVVWRFFQHYMSYLVEDSTALEQQVQHLLLGEYDERYGGRSFMEPQDLGQLLNQLAAYLDERNQRGLVGRENMQEILYHLTVGVMVLNEQREIAQVNPMMNEILGENLYGELGHDFSEVIMSARMVELIDASYRTGRVHNEEVTLYFQDEKRIALNVVPLEPDTNSGGVRVIVFATDVTEMRRLEQVRIDFVANASHELRTPLTALRGFTETLLDGAQEDPAAREEFLRIILKEANRLDNIVQDILKISRMEQPGPERPAVPTRIDLNELVRETLLIFQQKTEHNELECVLHLEEQLEMEAEADQVTQILINLIGNAINYTPAGGRIDIGARQVDDQIELTVADTGVGIPQKDQLRIFERFYRVDKARSQHVGGTGLGLSIVRGLVENMGGTIDLHSIVGEGTTLTVRLPRVQADAETAEQSNK